MIDSNFRPKIYLINLDKSKDRLDSCFDRLNKQNVTFQRISAVLGDGLTEQQKSRNYSQKLNEEKYHYQLTNGEIGCYLSHRKAWEKIANSDDPYAVVLEDDIKLIGDFNLAITAMNNLPFDWQIIKLSSYKVRKRKVAFCVNADNGFKLAVHKKPMTGCAATAITSGAAIKLLEHSEVFGRPVDVDIQHFWEKNIYVHSLLPYPISQDMSYQSTICNRKVRQEVSFRFWRRKRQQFNSYFLNKAAVKSHVLELKNMNL